MDLVLLGLMLLELIALKLCRDIFPLELVEVLAAHGSQHLLKLIVQKLCRDDDLHGQIEFLQLVPLRLMLLELIVLKVC